MKLNELKNGATVECRDGVRRLYLKGIKDDGSEEEFNGFIELQGAYNFCYLGEHSYNENLLYVCSEGDSEYDIMKVCNRTYAGDNLQCMLEDKKDWTWERREVIVTRQEIADKFNCNVSELRIKD